MRSADRAAALVFLGLSIAYAATAASIEQAVESPAFVLGPRGFPLVLGAGGIVVSLVLLWSSIGRPPAAAPAGGTAPAPAGALAGDWRRTLALCALTLLYALALPRAGFLLSTIAFLAAGFRLLGERRALVLLGVSAVTAAAMLGALRALGAHVPEPLFSLLASAP